MIINLLEETIDILKWNKKTLDDILFITDDSDNNFKITKITTEKLKEILNIEYNNGFGGEEINAHLKLVGQNFWLEREIYDGSEWWEYKELPIYDSEKETPISHIIIKREYLDDLGIDN